VSTGKDENKWVILDNDVPAENDYQVRRTPGNTIGWIRRVKISGWNASHLSTMMEE
jgi:hypothetical protein